MIVPRAQPEFGFDFAIAYPVGVSSLLTPKGPAPASVYWRRRVVVLAVLFVVILLLGKACSGGKRPAPCQFRQQGPGEGIARPRRIDSGNPAAQQMFLPRLPVRMRPEKMLLGLHRQP